MTPDPQAAPPRAAPLSAAAVAALHRGSKIEAIKIVREEQTLGLKEAKDIVDAAMQAQPELRAAAQAANAQGRQGLLRWLAIIVIVGVALAYFYGG